MDTCWLNQFRQRMQEFGARERDGFVPVSIKIRPVTGCFHREHSSEAYRIIDRHTSDADFSDAHHRIEEHESGPEILVYLAVTTAGLSLAKSIVELITAIIKARSEGIKKGDKPSDPLELIVCGHSKDGEYFEEHVLRIPPSMAVTTKQIEDAVRKAQPAKKRKKAAKKK